MYLTKIQVINMSKKKKEHVTFDRMADKRIRINKKAFIINESLSKKINHVNRDKDDQLF